MLTDTEKLDEETKDDIINVIKRVLKKYTMDRDINVDKYKEFLTYINSNPPWIIFNYYCPFSKYFGQRIITDLNNSLYAFKSPNHAIEMLENNDLRLTSLKKNEENDPLEYQEFWYRLGNISRMIPDNYDTKIKNWLCNNKYKIPMDEDREQIYIYCLTRNPSPKHWTEYGDNDKNVCIEYNFKSKTDNNGPFKDGNVYYDNGYDFDFLREINYYIRAKYGLFFSPSGWTKFALFYKRDKYRWEEETRLSLNSANWPAIRESAKRKENGLEFKDGDADCGIICIKNDNDYVNWEVKSITIGANCPKEDREKIKNIIKNYINTKIIER
ncbi:MAG: hypothetical protein FWB90_07285 [Fibromonadales bacterium]|nr:hypothetical protein [Fibromonadales bacterium]